MVGEVLKRERLAKGISLEKVASDIKIRVTYLKAIEEGAFDSFPADVYTIGYIRAYALYLGIDPDPLIKEFKDLKRTVTEYSSEEQCRGSGRLRNGAVVSLVNGVEPLATKLVAKWSVRGVISGIIILLIVIFMASVFRKTGEIKSQKIFPQLLPPPPEEKSGINSTMQHAVPQLLLSPNDSGQQRGDKDNAGTASGLILKIVASELTWLKVETDEKTYEATLRPGESVQYESKKGFKLKLGNAGGVRLNLNGRDLGFPGKSGEVRVVFLP
jgi:cytoskeleton protein RodZ